MLALLKSEKTLRDRNKRSPNTAAETTKNDTQLKALEAKLVEARQKGLDESSPHILGLLKREEALKEKIKGARDAQGRGMRGSERAQVRKTIQGHISDAVGRVNEPDSTALQLGKAVEKIGIKAERARGEKKKQATEQAAAEKRAALEAKAQED